MTKTKNDRRQWSLLGLERRAEVEEDRGLKRRARRRIESLDLRGRAAASVDDFEDGRYKKVGVGHIYISLILLG